jgi:hypothetical protein
VRARTTSKMRLSTASSSSSIFGSVTGRISGASRSLWRARSTRLAASLRTGSTTSATSAAITARGMPSCVASRGSCTNTRPPASFTALAPTAPSEPPPDRTTANPSPWFSASERKKRSIEARRSRLLSNGAAEIVVSLIRRLRSGAITYTVFGCKSSVLPSFTSTTFILVRRDRMLASSLS